MRMRMFFLLGVLLFGVFFVSAEMSSSGYTDDPVVTGGGGVFESVGYASEMVVGILTGFVTSGSYEVALGVFFDDVVAVVASFVSPTLSDGAFVNVDYVEVNVSIVGSGLSDVVWNWNGSNYSVLDDSLVLMMNFDNVSALGENDSFVVDVSGKGNDGVGVFNGSGGMSGSGKYGGGVYFDGDGDYVKVSNYNKDDGGTEITVSVWIKEASWPQYASAVSNVRTRFTTRAGDWELYLLGVTNGSNYDSNITHFGDDLWHHFAATYNGSMISIYVDGALQLERIASGGIDWGTDFYVGRTSNTSSEDGNGLVDEVRIWNRSFSASEVERVYMSNLNKYDSDKWLFYVNESGLSEGTYNYGAWAYNGVGDWSFTGERNVTVDLSVPLIDFVSPTPDNGSAISGTSVYVNVSASDSGEHSVFLDWNRSLVGWWRMEDNENDSSSWGNHEVDCADCVYDSGKRGRGLELDGWNASGTQQCLMLPHDDELNIVNSSYTVSAWVMRKGGTLGRGTIIIKRHSVSPWGSYRLYIDDDGTFSFNNRNASGSSLYTLSDEAIPFDEWKYLVAVYNGTHQYMYIDGVLQADVDELLTTFSSDGELRIGCDGTGGSAYSYRFNGTLDEVMVFDRALSEEEVNASYDAGSYRLEVNFTGLSEGDYDYEAWAVDEAGNLNSSSREVSIEGVNVYDHFDFPDLNLTKWDNFSNGDSGTYSIANSNITLDPVDGVVNSVCIRSEVEGTDFTIRAMPTGSVNYLDISIGSGDPVGIDGATSWWHTTFPNGYVTRFQEYDNVDLIEMTNGVASELFGGSMAPTTENVMSEYRMMVNSSGVYVFRDGVLRMFSSDTTYSLGGYLMVCAGEYSSGNGDTVVIDWVNVSNVVPQVAFVSPTLGNGSAVNEDYVEVNVTIKEADLDEVVWGWNGTNYTLFNDSLVLMMNFDNVSALGENDTFVVDVSGRGNDGAVVNGAVVNTTNCKFRNCYTFDGAGANINYINVGSDSSLDNVFLNGGTIVAWIYQTQWDTTINYIYNKDDGAGDYVDFIWTDQVNNYLLIKQDFGGNDGQWATPHDSITLNTWHHIVVVYNSSSDTNDPVMYIDGISQNVNQEISPSGTTQSDANGDFEIGGRSAGSRSFPGEIDEFRVWNRSLSVSEVEQVYMSNLAKFDSDSWLLYVNESDLSEGDYVYEVWAGDEDGEWGSSGERMVTVMGDSSGYFKSSWNTSKAGISDSTSVSLPLEAGGSYDFRVYWGDGTYGDVTAWDDVDANHTYASEGVWNVTISGTIVGWRFNGGGDRLKILDVMNWGVLNVGNNGSYFDGCENLDSSASDSLNLSGTTNLMEMFRGTSIFNGTIGGWDVSGVTDMRWMFDSADAFNQDIGSWNVSSVTTMAIMFYSADAFNQDIGSWDVSNVDNMEYMFGSAAHFNQNISGWNVSRVVDMKVMFAWASNFNGSIGNWDVSNVENMHDMFYSANAFNQDIGTWNVSSVTDMGKMFYSAGAFNQDIGSWNVSNVIDFSGMLNGTGISVDNYDALLIGWDGLSSGLSSGETFGVSGLEYCFGEGARTSIESGDSWTFSGDSLNCDVTLLDINESGVVDGDIEMGDNVTINVSFFDNSVVSEVWVKVWEGAVGVSSVIWEGFLSLVGGFWTVTFGTNSSFGSGEVNYTVFANDSLGNLINESGEFTIANIMPNNVNVRLVSVDGLNLTTSDLNCSGVVSDADGDDLNVSVRWYNDGVLNLSVDYLNDYSNGTLFWAVLDSGNTTKGENWSCGVRVFDGSLYSGWVNSSEVEILNSLPVVTLVSPTNWNTTTNRSLEFTWSGFDADGDSLTYEITVNEQKFTGPFACSDDRSDNDVGGESYVPSSDLLCLYDNGFYYNWSVRANDGTGWGDWSSVWHFNVTAQVSINLASDSIEFGSLLPGNTEDTSDDTPNPFVLDNDGNVVTNISLNSTALWEQAASDSVYYRFKADNVTGEEGSFSWLLSIVDWFNMPITGEVVGLGELNYVEGDDSAEVDIALEVPDSESPGPKSTNIIFKGVLAE